MLGNFGSDLRRNPLPATMDGANRIQKVLAHRTLEEKARSSGTEGASSAHIALVRRQCNNSSVRKLPADCDDRFDAAYFWHLQIHERHVRTMRTKGFDRIASVRRFANQHHVLLTFQQRGNPLAE